MKTIWICLTGLALAGCQSVPPPAKVAERARFFLESPDGQGELVILPQSGSQITISPKAVLTEFDVVGVRIAQVDLGECLAFQFTPAAARDLARLSRANLGRRLVLELGGIAFGARHMAQPLDQGVLLVFVEVPDAELPALVASLNETAAALHPATKR